MYGTSVGHIVNIVADGVHANPEAQSPWSSVAESEGIPEDKPKWTE